MTILATILLAVMPNLGMWTFSLPWDHTVKDPLGSLEELSKQGHCVEVCWALNGHLMHCTPLEYLGQLDTYVPCHVPGVRGILEQ
jgi:hypothetical protein